MRFGHLPLWYFRSVGEMMIGKAKYTNYYTSLDIRCFASTPRVELTCKSYAASQPGKDCPLS